MARNYEDLVIIGKGAYGTVYKAKDVENDRTVALKQVRIVNNSEEKGVPVSTLREITLLKQLDNVAHPNIVRMFDAFQTFSDSQTREGHANDLVLTIVFEHVEQDLSMFLHNSPPHGLSEPLIKDLMFQLLSGLDYLHINRLIHRDIKPQNILITKNKQVKIADFGLARVYGFCKLITSVVVTLWYRPPELLLHCPYATKVDIWSVGAIMAEMYNRRPLFPGKSDLDQLQKVLKVIGTPSKNEWPEKSSLPWENFKNLNGIDFRHLIPRLGKEGFDLLQNLLVFDPNKRWNAKSCLSHPYFNEVVSNCTTVEPVNNQDKNNNANNGVNVEINSLKREGSFSRIVSGIDLSSSSASDDHPFSRSDSGICLSPAAVECSSSNDDLSNENECIVGIIENTEVKAGNTDDEKNIVVAVKVTENKLVRMKESQDRLEISHEKHVNIATTSSNENNLTDDLALTPPRKKVRKE